MSNLKRNSVFIDETQVFSKKIDNQYMQLIIDDASFVLDYDTLIEMLFQLSQISQQMEMTSLNLPSNNHYKI